MKDTIYSSHCNDARPKIAEKTAAWTMIWRLGVAEERYGNKKYWLASSKAMRHNSPLFNYTTVEYNRPIYRLERITKSPPGT